MKILIFGGNGMLGHKLAENLKNDFEVWATVRKSYQPNEKLQIFDRLNLLENVDVENEGMVSDVIHSVKPEVIINAVGIIKQLPTSQNVIKTLTVNSIFPHRLAGFARQLNARLITISTDCVFDGKTGNYVENDVSNATDLYGKSKFLGEVAFERCLTLRTSIIGRELETEHSLIEWFLKQKGGKIKGYVNAVYTGFPTIILSRIISGIIKNFPDLQGLYHVSSNSISKYELLCLIRDELRLDIEIEPFEEFYVDRSLNSERFQNATGYKPPDWVSMIRDFASDPFPYENIRKSLRKFKEAETRAG